MIKYRNRLLLAVYLAAQTIWASTLVGTSSSENIPLSAPFTWLFILSTSAALEWFAHVEWKGK